MIEATQTSGGSASEGPAIACSLPSIEALGRRPAAVNAASLAGGNAASSGRGAGKGILTDQADALSDLISTMRAQTLADAAVQAHVAADCASILTRTAFTEMEPRDLARYLTKLERLLLSIVPTLVEATGMDAGNAIFTDDARLTGSRFAAVEAVP